jgi:GrpB-like predicted nucleotidyltransferase (UPF0157 family)
MYPGRMRLLHRGPSKVEVVSPDESWADRFDAERVELERLLAPWLDGGVHHVGSTAVPGLAARPIVDILAGVRSESAARAAAPVLERAGWRRDGELGEGGLRFSKRTRDRGAYQLDLFPAASPRFAERLELREALRDDPHLAEAFNVLKRELAARAPHDDRGFSEAKEGFITGVLRARAEARRTSAPSPRPPSG